MKRKSYRGILKGKRVAMGVFSLVPFLMGIAGWQGCDRCDIEHCNLVPQEVNADRILAIGDSITAYYSKKSCGCCQSYTDYASIEIGEHIQNMALGGTHLSEGKGIPIPQQYANAKAANGPYDLVILTGGGNDLPECAITSDSCMESCGSKVEEIVEEMETLVTDIVRDGSDVIMVGYYQVNQLPSSMFGHLASYEECQLEIASRYQEIADSNSQVTFVDTRELADPLDATDYAVDGLHPSIALAKKIGKRVADAF